VHCNAPSDLLSLRNLNIKWVCVLMGLHMSLEMSWCNVTSCHVVLTYDPTVNRRLGRNVSINNHNMVENLKTTCNHDLAKDERYFIHLPKTPTLINIWVDFLYGSSKDFIVFLATRETFEKVENVLVPEGFLVCIQSERRCMKTFEEVCRPGCRIVYYDTSNPNYLIEIQKSSERLMLCFS